MRKAALLYNPASGGSRQRRSELESALAILRAGGVEAELIPTESPDHAEQEARRATAAECDTVFACGGDGTVHVIAQALATTSVALGILPMGTANALAHDLGIPLRVPAAAKAALKSGTRRVALGRVTCTGIKGGSVSCYFIVAAGIGVDAHLFYKLHSGVKQRLGMAAYYHKAWHLWFTYPMTWFRVQYQAPDSPETKTAEVTELLAVRIRQFGGILRELAPGGSLDRNDMRLILCRTSSRLAYLAYVTRSLLGLPWTTRGIELSYSTQAVCDYLPPLTADAPKVYVEADGELLGTLPAEFTIVQDALTLLAPKR